MRRFLVFMLVLSGCTLPVSYVSPTPSQTPTLTPTRIPTETIAPTITRTPETIALSYPVTITVTPWGDCNCEITRQLKCLLDHYDFEWLPGTIKITLRDQEGYFACVARK